MTKSKFTIMRIATAAILTITSIYVFAPWEFGLYYLKSTPETIEQELANAVDERLDGIVVYVDRNGEPPEFYAKGYHNRDTKTPADPQALPMCNLQLRQLPTDQRQQWKGRR